MEVDNARSGEFAETQAKQRWRGGGTGNRDFLCPVTGMLDADGERMSRTKFCVHKVQQLLQVERGLYFRRVDDLFALLGDNLTTLLLRQT